ncbi:beta-ketoacyl synthase-like protein [Sinobacterium caligoides]|uniref:Beta-ketoacyl synthase-like protein n=1 Tax=Sinobacterium caligoides TaxID=933926 RepID=A0A3N2DPG0_9GAMM|nr:beta-ketoacyl synthase chain length factor [Sinobacterium caligoides]ROS01592.1 beta-ketoacyl synthase-like protein [Sinobacterium caligoides]
MKVALSIADWFALSTECDDRNAWRQKFSLPTREEGEVVILPAMMRRRMSGLTKLTLRCSLSLAQRAEHIDYAVFASRHGELQRTGGLLQSLADDDLLSPMGFAQSVHNTAAGLHTIISQQKLPISSMAAGKQSFAQAWLEAFIYLRQHPHATVLLQYFDEPVPEKLSAFCRQPGEALALGLLVKASPAMESPSLPYRNDEDLPEVIRQLLLTGEAGVFSVEVCPGNENAC